MKTFLATLLSPFLNRPRPAMDTRLVGSRVLLRMGDPADWREWRNLREASRDFLTPWEPSWPDNALTYRFFCGLLRRFWRDWRRGKAYAFFIFLRDEAGHEGHLVGGIALNDVRHDDASKGTLGYWIGLPYVQQGLMTEAVGLMCDFAYHTLHLQKVEAACLPRNLASITLLRRHGFTEEGFAKAHLQINGQWEDHLLWRKKKVPTNPAAFPPR